MSARKKNRKRKDPGAAELNIMPFIDIFSMLNTFLLVSAAFINIGILEVQIPFFSNAPAEKSKPTRSLDIKVDVEKTKVTLTTLFTLPPEDKQTFTYTPDQKGLDDMHAKLLELRQKNPDGDKVTIYSDDDVKYSGLVDVVDTVKTLREKDPKFPVTDEKTGVKKESVYLYEKVVIGSVVL